MKKWNIEDDTFLVENHKIIPKKLLAEKLQRTEISIEQRIKYLKNLGKIEKEKHNTVYTREEKKYLVNNYNKKTLEEMSVYLKRTPTAISDQIKNLKKRGKINEIKDLKSILKNLMISKRDVIKEKILFYEKIMIAEKLKTSPEKLEEQLKKLRLEYEEQGGAHVNKN